MYHGAWEFKIYNYTQRKSRPLACCQAYPGHLDAVFNAERVDTWLSILNPN